jgi:hypothetical protein
MEENEKTDRKTEYFCLFESHEQFVSYLAAVTITGDRAAN